MTDTTDIAALRERLQSAISQHEMMMDCVMGLSRVDPMYQQCLDALNDLEAERQRADKLQSTVGRLAQESNRLFDDRQRINKSWTEAESDNALLRDEIAALKTDIESYISINGELATEVEELKAKLANPVVLPNKRNSDPAILTYTDAIKAINVAGFTVKE